MTPSGSSRSGLLEELKSAAAAAQAVVTADLVASQRAEQRAAGVPERDLGKGVAAQVALARRESPHRGSRLVGLAQALVHEMPATMAALQAGEISEWRATLVARETACLTREDRAGRRRELAGRLARLGDRECEAAARAVAYRLDPHAFTARSTGAVRDRRVTLRPAPDTMSRLSGFLPVAQGVAAYAALSREADALKAAGDGRSRGQIMADTLVERLTGQAAADAVPVEVELVMTEGTLLAGADEPAHLVGLGPIPAPIARDLARDTDADVWLRRLFTRPDDGALVAHGVPPAAVPRPAAPVPRAARPDLPHPLVRGTHPPRRPRHPGRGRRGRPAPATAKACAKPATTPNKPPAGEPDPAPRRRADRADHHPHRAHLHQPTPTPTRPTAARTAARPRHRLARTTSGAATHDTSHSKHDSGSCSTPPELREPGSARSAAPAPTYRSVILSCTQCDTGCPMRLITLPGRENDRMSSATDSSSRIETANDSSPDSGCPGSVP